MCLTMHFTAKLLKSCAVYTPACEYLSAGQFNYPAPSVISAALLSRCVFFLSFLFFFAAGVKDLAAASLRYGRLRRSENTRSCSNIAQALPGCTRAFPDTAHIKSFQVRGGGGGGGGGVSCDACSLKSLRAFDRGEGGTHGPPNPPDSSADI